MHLYLLRHGQAEPQRQPDAERRLTEIGKQEVRRVAHQFAAKNIHLAASYYSPYVRTTETCELFMQEAAQMIKPEPQPVLVPQSRASDVLRWLRDVKADHVLLVTHNPLVSEILAVLSGQEPENMHIFATSELNALECEGVSIGGGTLQFRLYP